MAVSWVQNSTKITGAATTTSATLAMAVNAGDLLVCVTRFSGTAPANAVTDNINGNWKQVNLINNVYLYYFNNSGSAGLSGLTITVNAGASGTIRLSADHFTGITNPVALTGSNTTSTASGSTWTAAVTSNAVGGQLVYAGIGSGTNTDVVTAGTSNGSTMMLGGTMTDAALGTIASEYLLSSAQGLQNASFSFSDGTTAANGGQAVFNVSGLPRTTLDISLTSLMGVG